MIIYNILRRLSFKGSTLNYSKSEGLKELVVIPQYKNRIGLNDVK